MISFIELSFCFNIKQIKVTMCTLWMPLGQRNKIWMVQTYCSTCIFDSLQSWWWSERAAEPNSTNENSTKLSSKQNGDTLNPDDVHECPPWVSCVMISVTLNSLSPDSTQKLFVETFNFNSKTKWIFRRLIIIKSTRGKIWQCPVDILQILLI